MEMMKIVKGKISVFCNQSQCYPYMMFGDSGCRSISAWMGPRPVLRLHDACFAGDWEAAEEICLDIDAAYKAPRRRGDLFWRENSHKLAINEAGYCNAGPLRPPFRHVPADIIEYASNKRLRGRNCARSTGLKKLWRRRSGPNP